MTMMENAAHLSALAKHIGVCPKHRDPTPGEIELVKAWGQFRSNAYRESIEHSKLTGAE